MATKFVVLLPESESKGVDAAFEALESLDQIEADLTIYRDSSEISKLNRLGAENSVKLSASTFDLLQRALHWSKQTNGAFDITAGPLVDAWGFTTRSGRKPSNDEIEAARRRIGHQHLKLDAEAQAASLAMPDMRVNLGAIGKGHALDLVAQNLKTAGLHNFLIHGGNSSVIASGDQNPEGDEETRKGWLVGIAHPTKPTRRVGGVWLKNAALGTSGSGKQFFHHQGRRYGHVIDPRTGLPAGDLLSLTVITESATDADAAATGYFVLGAEHISKLDHSELAMAMITVAAARRQDEVKVQTFGELTFVDD